MQEARGIRLPFQMLGAYELTLARQINLHQYGIRRDTRAATLDNCSILWSELRQRGLQLAQRLGITDREQQLNLTMGGRLFAPAEPVWDI